MSQIRDSVASAAIALAGTCLVSIGDASVAIGQKNVVRAQDKFNEALVNIRLIQKTLRRVKKKIASDDLPMKAYIATQEGYGDTFVAAKTASKARWIVVSGMREAGIRDAAQFCLIRVARVPKYDAWAQTAKRQCYGRDAMPVV